VAGTDAGPGGGALEDRELLAAHVAGDPEAFGILFGRHRDRLWAVALRTTGDPEEAADALQDGLVSAFRRADSFRGDAAVTTWLHRIVVNACLDRMRRQKVRATRPLPDPADQAAGGWGVEAHDDAASHQHPAASDPADLVLAEEQRATVARALASIPAEQRAALVLVDMQGFSVQEAADVLGCPTGTVKSRCARGRARLAPLLAALLGAAGGTPTAPAAGEPGGPAARPRPRGTTGGTAAGTAGETTGETAGDTGGGTR